LAVVGEFGAKQGRDMPGTWLVVSCTGRVYNILVLEVQGDTRFHARNIITFWKDLVLVPC
jgi:hypothetical protein